VRVSGVTVNDGNGGNNYNVIYADNTTSTITPASLVVTASGINKVYDGLINAGVTYTANGVIGSDVLNVTGTASYADKNAGTGKPSTSAISRCPERTATITYWHPPVLPPRLISHLLH